MKSELENSNPLVSVVMITYNQEQYIGDAINGVLMQNCNFDFEIIIADDCSKDNTRNVILEYVARFPNLFNLIFQKINIGAALNFLELINKPKTKYIALCDGDDYWTDPLKLQKQVDLMEQNDKIGMVYSATNFSGVRLKNYFSVENYINDGSPFLNTCTFLINRNSFNVKDIKSNFVIGDLQIVLNILKKGYSVNFLDENTAVYRVLEESASHTNDSRKNVIFFQDKLLIELSFLEDNELKKKLKIDFYNKYFNDLSYLNLNLISRISVSFILWKYKEKKRLMNFILYNNTI